MDAAFERAQALPDHSASWIDGAIVNIKVTGDVSAAEAVIREVWSGPLCISQGTRTDRELRAVADEFSVVPEILAAHPQSWGANGMSEVVELEVTYDDGTLQAFVDDRYGAGMVVVTSALVPVDAAPR